MPRPHRLSLAFCLAASLALWLIFYPTVFSRDSFYMLLDAARGTFTDMHPILIPVVTSAVLKLGGNIGLITLAQILLGLLGIRRLVIVLGRFFRSTEPQASPWVEVVIVGALASPLTPLAIYLSTTWSDTWLLILLVWSLGLLLELRESGPGSRIPKVKIAIVVIVLGLLILARYNAIAMFPFLAAALFGTLRRYRLAVVTALSLALMPLLLAGSFLVFQYRLHSIVPYHPERAVYALDLASMVLYDPSICNDLSLQSCDVILGEFSPAFRVGDGAIDLTFTQGNEFQYAPFLDLFYYRRLETEFFRAAIQHPWLLLRVKLLNFLDYLKSDPHQYFFQARIIPGDVRQLPQQAFASPDNLWFRVARQVHWNGALSWISYVHGVWLVIAMVVLVALRIRIARMRDDTALDVWLLLLAPTAYYLAHLVALTSSEFRFMYPATLVIQIVTLAYVASRMSRLRIIDGAARTI